MDPHIHFKAAFLCQYHGGSNNQAPLFICAAVQSVTVSIQAAQTTEGVRGECVKLFLVLDYGKNKVSRHCIATISAEGAAVAAVFIADKINAKIQERFEKSLASSDSVARVIIREPFNMIAMQTQALANTIHVRAPYEPEDKPPVIRNAADSSHV